VKNTTYAFTFAALALSACGGGDTTTNSGPLSFSQIEARVGQLTPLLDNVSVSPPADVLALSTASYSGIFVAGSTNVNFENDLFAAVGTASLDANIDDGTISGSVTNLYGSGARPLFGSFALTGGSINNAKLGEVDEFPITLNLTGSVADANGNPFSYGEVPLTGRFGNANAALVAIEGTQNITVTPSGGAPVNVEVSIGIVGEIE